MNFRSILGEGGIPQVARSSRAGETTSMQGQLVCLPM